MATVRIYKVAELLGISSQEAMSLLKSETGIEVKSASSSVEEIVARQFVERQARQRDIALPPPTALFADTAPAKKGGSGGKGAKVAEPPKAAPALRPRLVKTIKPIATPGSEDPTETTDAEEPAAADTAAQAPPAAAPEVPAAETPVAATPAPVAASAPAAQAPETPAAAAPPAAEKPRVAKAPAAAKTTTPEAPPAAPAAPVFSPVTKPIVRPGRMVPPSRRLLCRARAARGCLRAGCAWKTRQRVKPQPRALRPLVWYVHRSRPPHRLVRPRRAPRCAPA